MIQQKTLERIAEAGADDFGLNWYSRANQSIEGLASRLGCSVQHFAMLASGYSPRVSVLRSIKFACWHVATDGQIKPPGCMNAVHKLVNDGITRGYHNGPKIEAFRRCLLGCESSLVLDTWIAKALRVDQKALYQKAYYPAIESRFRATASNMGVCLADCQAMVWTGIMRQHGRVDLDLIPAARVGEILDFTKGV